MGTSSSAMDRLDRVRLSGSMFHRSLGSLSTIVAVGAGIAGGVFFAFSTFVMRALDRLPADRSIAAMQAINLAAPNPLFMAVLFGTGAAAAVVGLVSARHLGEPGAI